MKELQKLMNNISDWSNKTFGDGDRSVPILHHLQKEVVEAIDMVIEFRDVRYDDSVGVGEYGRIWAKMQLEFADCLMLLLDAAQHVNISAEELINATNHKLEVNKTRIWGKPDENGVIEHIKEE